MKNFKYSTQVLIWIIITLIIISLLLLRLGSLEGFFSESIWDKIDGVVYINLENRDDRKKLLLDELSKMQVPNNKIHKISGVHIPKNGHKGCVQSHILALKIAKMNNWDKVLILEDDAELKVNQNEFNDKMKKILDYVDKNTWNVVMLATENANKEDLEGVNDVKKINMATTSSAYLVNSNYYDKLSTLFNYLNKMMKSDKWTSGGHEDFALDQQWSSLQKNDLWFGLKDDMVKQRSISSSINERK